MCRHKLIYVCGQDRCLLTPQKLERVCMQHSQLSPSLHPLPCQRGDILNFSLVRHTKRDFSLHVPSIQFSIRSKFLYSLVELH